ncbi:hypothetical protein Glove_37g127 [Diversispora epigaea]|uniref:HTH APSES-type domain-containing protein n=1 Tax=Diversispora epigaea TaxID=1348612 RepID=A0A397JG77_9GLOM|nr:hypothetical protein Glove_37g127 [Diversispora epigaea]
MTDMNNVVSSESNTNNSTENNDNIVNIDNNNDDTNNDKNDKNDNNNNNNNNNNNDPLVVPLLLQKIPTQCRICQVKRKVYAFEVKNGRCTRCTRHYKRFKLEWPIRKMITKKKRDKANAIMEKLLKKQEESLLINNNNNNNNNAEESGTQNDHEGGKENATGSKTMEEGLLLNNNNGINNINNNNHNNYNNKLSIVGTTVKNNSINNIINNNNRNLNLSRKWEPYFHKDYVVKTQQYFRYTEEGSIQCTAYAYEFRNGIIRWDVHAGHIHMNPVKRISGHPTMRLEKLKCFHSSWKKEKIVILGGNIEYQGTWYPFDQGKAMIKELIGLNDPGLYPIFGPDVIDLSGEPSSTTTPTTTGFSSYIITGKNNDYSNITAQQVYNNIIKLDMGNNNDTKRKRDTANGEKSKKTLKKLKKT